MNICTFAASLGGCYSRGLGSPILLPGKMIEKENIANLVGQHIDGTGIFIVDVVVKAGNAIRVWVDRPGGITIDECVEISRFLNGQLDRDVEDYSLEVSSPGADSPFRVRQQYEKNIGRQVEITLMNGTSQEGTLGSVLEESVILEVKGKKSEIRFEDIKKTKAVLSFY
jgi:ribosome maturation factor RimP